MDINYFIIYIIYMLLYVIIAIYYLTRQNLKRPVKISSECMLYGDEGTLVFHAANQISMLWERERERERECVCVCVCVCVWEREKREREITRYNI